MLRFSAATALALTMLTGCASLTLPEATDLRLAVTAPGSAGGELSALFYNASHHEIGVGELGCKSRIEQQLQNSWHPVSRWSPDQDCQAILIVVPPRGSYPFRTPAPTEPGIYRMVVDAIQERGAGSDGMNRDRALTAYSKPFTVTAP